jgi:hypothetical protein
VCRREAALPRYVVGFPSCTAASFPVQPANQTGGARQAQRPPEKQAVATRRQAVAAGAVAGAVAGALGGDVAGAKSAGGGWPIGGKRNCIARGGSLGFAESPVALQHVTVAANRLAAGPPPATRRASASAGP